MKYKDYINNTDLIYDAYICPQLQKALHKPKQTIKVINSKNKLQIWESI